MKKINFKSVAVQLEIEGNPVNMDLAKEIGNFVYQNTSDLGAVDLAKRIYHSDSEIELSNTELTTLVTLIEGSMIKVPIRIALLNELKDDGYRL